MKSLPNFPFIVCGRGKYRKVKNFEIAIMILFFLQMTHLHVLLVPMLCWFLPYHDKSAQSRRDCVKCLVIAKKQLLAGLGEDKSDYCDHR